MVSASPFHVSKFGGTSVANAERIRHAVALVNAASDGVRRIVVVSALGGVTDELIAALDAANERDGTHRERLAAIRARHVKALGEIASEADRNDVASVLEQRFLALGELLDGVALLREVSPRTRDAVLGTGERLSAPLVAAAFRTAGKDAVALDATAFIRTDATFGNAIVDFATTERLVRESMGALPVGQVAVVTGFVGSTSRGVTTTLGRSGSDYTATIIGGALRAKEVVIWTDVAGVYTADPRLVPEAFPLPRLSYREAAEMAYFGAKVLHPRTMLPVERHAIPIIIKSTYEPERPGTLITPETDETGLRVKAFSSITDVAVVMLEGAGMQEVPGTISHAFEALAGVGVNVLMVSQASSEQSICIVVSQADADMATDALERAFRAESDRGDIRDIYSIPDCSVLSAVGDRMRESPGLAGRLFASLGRASVNVLAIAQGAAETNISAVVAKSDVKRALGALHESFPMRRTRSHVCLIGTGVVGRKLVDILAEHAPSLLADNRINLKLVGVTNSRTMRWDPDGLPIDTVLGDLASGEPADLDELMSRLTTSGLERLIVVDATASEQVARRYGDLLDNGIGVVTPNKRANTLDLAYYRRLREAAQHREVSYHYETTVMAGLPVVFTLRDLLRSGDQIESIEGVFSGTLAFLFNRLAEGALFSSAVREAKALGLTEPDPRDDLSGEDVARKLLILAREIGLSVERSDVRVESLVPKEMQALTAHQFMDGLESLDHVWSARLAEATASNGRLAFVGQVGRDALRVGVEAVPNTPPYGGQRGTDNIILIRSKRYCDTPLVVQGPGAGPDVTAAGLLADLVKAAELMS